LPPPGSRLSGAVRKLQIIGVKMPLIRISVNIHPTFLVGFFVSQNGIVKGCLKQFLSRCVADTVNFSCCYRLVCTYNIRNRITQLQTFSCFQKPENNMNMGRHNHIFIHLQIIIALLQCQQLLLCNESLFRQYDLSPFSRGCCPDAGQRRSVSRPMNGYEIIPRQTVVIRFQSWIFSFGVVHNRASSTVGASPRPTL